MTTRFPRERDQFCLTSDGQPVFQVWRYTATRYLTFWYSLNPIQFDGHLNDAFDVREVGELPRFYDPEGEDMKTIIGRSTAGQLAAAAAMEQTDS